MPMHFARLLLLACAACAAADPAPLPGSAGALHAGPTWQELASPTAASLRGLAVVDRDVVWVSGTGGALWRTLDGGRSWQAVAPPDTAACDFRDLHAASADVALALVAGQPARLYRTTDGGRTWAVVFADPAPEAFLDGIAVHGAHGVLFGDPHDGAFVVATSADGGATWQTEPRERLPAPLAGEAGFAASGTLVDVGADGTLRIATGGGAARLLRRTADGVWTASPLPLRQGAASQGAFGLAFADDRRGVAVGGDYAAAVDGIGTSTWTDDGGSTWHAGGTAGGYRSGVVWLGGERFLAVGEAGASISADAGRSWRPFGAFGFHAVARGRDGSVVACGSGGRIARLVDGGTP